MSAIARFVATEPAVVPGAGDLGETAGPGLVVGRPTARGLVEVGLPGRAPEGPLDGETTAAKVVPAVPADAIRVDVRTALMRSVANSANYAIGTTVGVWVPDRGA